MEVRERHSQGAERNPICLEQRAGLGQGGERQRSELNRVQGEQPIVRAEW